MLRAGQGTGASKNGKYDISMDCGEQALLPAVRAADQDALVVANGFSCKTQIEDSGTRRRALHLAEVMQLAREGARNPAGGTDDGRPEERSTAMRPAPQLWRRTARVSAVGAALGAATIAGWGARAAAARVRAAVTSR